MSSSHPVRTAIVTGAAGTLGGGIARRLHADGHRVLLLDRTAESLAGLATELDDAPVFGFDLTDRAAITAFTAEVDERFGGCDILVNNAGINLAKPDGAKFTLPEVDDAGWDLMLAVCLTAPFLLCRGVITGMADRGWGRIITISSRAGRTYVPASNVHYSAAKAGVIAMTRMIAGEFGESGVTANSIAPGRVDSALASTNSPEIIAASMAAIPLHRSGTADEVAATVSFLASEGAGYITGATIDVNGGSFMAS
jgi:3-oxoacyl-[acyl-carrier protein] reductase